MAGIHLFDHDTHVQVVEPGHVVFDQGDSGGEMFAVLDGVVELRRDGELIHTAEKGDVFGEMALIDDSPRSARAQAVSEARVVAVDRKRFMFLVQEHPTFALQVMASMADKLRR
jgi:CRP/FNR family transcriptional regulator, cyclic AMP receptor protein